MIVLDACVLIAHLDASDTHHDHAGQLLLAAAGDQLATSALTLAEVLVGPARAGQLNRAEAALRQLGIQAVPLDKSTAVQLARLRSDTNLTMPDCCVLLAAEQTSAAALATFDDRLGKAAHERGLTVWGRL